MTEHWEYLSLTYNSATSVEQSASGSRRRYNQSYSVRRPDGVVEERRGDLSVDVLLNELGNDGWELVSETVWHTAIMEGVNGWTESGSPVTARWTFKRPCERKADPSAFRRYMDQHAR